MKRAHLRALFGAALLALFAISCGSGDDHAIDFNAAVDPTRPAPRGRPYPCPPTTAPDSGTLCSTRGLSCEYPRGVCTCDPDPNGAFGELAWICPFNSAPEMCPTAAPAPGSMCTALVSAMECAYGKSKACGCADELEMWTCWDPAQCPKGMPDNQSECDPVGMTCGYGASRCECLTTGWQCGS